MDPAHLPLAEPPGTRVPLTGALRRILAGVPYCGAFLRLQFSYSLNLDPTRSGEIYGPPSRAFILGKAKYIWEVAWYPRGYQATSQMYLAFSC